MSVALLPWRAGWGDFVCLAGGRRGVVVDLVDETMVACGVERARDGGGGESPAKKNKRGLG
mgnify:CR=1 FL=1